MCGIAGIVQDEPSSGSTTDWLAVIACLQALGNSSICVASPDSLEDKVSVAESQTFPLREYQQIRSLMELEDVQRQLSDVSQGLVRFDQDLLTAVNAPEAALSIEAMERWNSLSIRIRDLAWLIERDVLQYIPRLRSLIVPEFEANPKAWFKAWKLAVTLENIGRMEVRGRDSLGISLMVNFPTQESYRNWISNTQGRFAEELEKRRDAIEFVNQAIIQDDDTESPGLVFVYKVAQEVGALGDNVAAIYQSISQDALAWSALMVPQVTTNIFSHTRWASHGVISEPNCHPVNEVTLKDGACAIAQSPHRVVVCLNGDVDNYQDLIHRFASQEARFVPGRVSTDTKIIPMLVDYYFRQSNDMREAFCKAVSDCEGSIAIIMQNTHEPHKTYLALRGSGQALFVGLCQGGYIFASELYGVVEQTTKFVRMDGTTERVAGRPETAGQVFVLDTAKRGVEGIEVYSFDGASLGSEVLKVHSAEITTRDINRGSFSHFLLKEISEAPESIRKTIRGKFFLSRVDDQLKVRMNLDERVIPKRVLELLQQGQLRRVYLIGQGTAAVAGQAVSVIMQKMLGGAITVQALKATELSGYSMDKDLSDALVIAISQSGTTTDTNRTIDMPNPEAPPSSASSTDATLT